MDELRRIVKDIFILMLIVTLGLFLYKYYNPYYFVGVLERMLWADVAVGLLLFALYAEKFAKRKKRIKTQTRKVINIIFQLLLVLFLIAILIKEVFNFNFINLNYLLILVLLFGFLTVIKPPKKKQKEEVTEKDYVFIIMLSIVGSFLVWYKTQNIAISGVAGIFIILLSILILKES